MTTTDHGVLHEATETFQWFKPDSLVSMLDLMGTFKVTCAICRRWQTTARLAEPEAIQDFRASGWKMPEEVCPRCTGGSQCRED